MRTGSTRLRKTSEAPGSSRREEPRARLIQKNEEYRRNQHSGARRARFREFSSCGGREEGSRRSLNIETRRGGGTDCPRAAHTIWSHLRTTRPNAQVFNQYITDMNQFTPIDSKVSLDAVAGIEDSGLMISQLYRLYVERSDVSRNMARYYAMSIEPTLFGEICLLRKWGRIGKNGQMKVHHFGREEEAVQLFLELLRQKRQRGYRPRAAWPNCWA